MVSLAVHKNIYQLFQEDAMIKIPLRVSSLAMTERIDLFRDLLEDIPIKYVLQVLTEVYNQLPQEGPPNHSQEEIQS